MINLLIVSQSLASLLVHLVFSTKDRKPWLDDDFRDDLHGYIGGILASVGGRLLAAGSVVDHIHLLISHPRTISPADLVKEIKIGSSKWVKERDRSFGAFHWQGGYGMFSISPGHGDQLEKYIANQAEHHRKTTFQDEFRRLLTRYGVEWDERYVWD
ncbi:IS200/IS605 family transposase [Luteolibacter sp. Populi]|uniref:IS200/IS605 family transposase n=1 Tax=Luteolibacter sp. Populi TaxID=3230487 RepID=UPI00346581F2